MLRGLGFNFFAVGLSQRYLDIMWEKYNISFQFSIFLQIAPVEDSHSVCIYYKKWAFVWYFMKNLLLKTACNNSAPTGRIFIKFDIWVRFKICLENSSFIKIPTRMTGTLHEDQYTFLIMSCSSLHKMRNISDRICRENQNTHFMYNNDFPKMTIWSTLIACWIPKDTDT